MAWDRAGVNDRLRGRRSPVGRSWGGCASTEPGEAGSRSYGLLRGHPPCYLTVMPQESSGPASTPICGIVMPISTVDDDHTEEHWRKVLSIHRIAIESAGLTPQPVWNSEHTPVIHAKILGNLFENDVVLCDISTRNPNVMVELGIRLATKRPTIIVAEKGTPLPFDTSVVQTEFYDPRRDYEDTNTFIEKVSAEIATAYRLSKAGTYRTYLENFTFQTIEPTTVAVTGEEAIRQMLGEILGKVDRIDSRSRVQDAWKLATSLEDKARGNFLESLFLESQKAKNQGRSDMMIDIGDTVRHFKYGVGTVKDINGAAVDVFFEKAGGKTIAVSSLEPHLSDDRDE